MTSRANEPSGLGAEVGTSVMTPAVNPFAGNGLGFGRIEIKLQLTLLQLFPVQPAITFLTQGINHFLFLFRGGVLTSGRIDPAGYA